MKHILVMLSFVYALRRTIYVLCSRNFWHNIKYPETCIASLSIISFYIVVYYIATAYGFNTRHIYDLARLFHVDRAKAATYNPCLRPAEASVQRLSCPISHQDSKVEFQSGSISNPTQWGENKVLYSLSTFYALERFPFPVNIGRFAHGCPLSVLKKKKKNGFPCLADFPPETSPRSFPS